MRIMDLQATDLQAIVQAATMLVEGFKEHWPMAWPDMDAALQEVQESLAPERISRIAVDEQGAVLGWIGGIRQYAGHVWELHPLVVQSNCRGQGLGRALVADLEAQVSARGGLTIWLGTDDENNMTSLAGVDLFPDVLERLANLRNLRGHPYEFYLKVGFTIVGVLPDANGPGKPDIFMAKPVRPR